MQGPPFLDAGMFRPIPRLKGLLLLYCQALMKVYSTRMLLVFSGVFTFLVDAYPLYS